MSNFEVKELVLENINGGRQYTDSDGVSASAINAVVEASAWAQKTAKEAKMLVEASTGTNFDTFYSFLLDKFVPLHKVQIFTDNTNPAELYGGYWIKLKDAFLWCSGDETYITYTKNGVSVTEYLSVGSRGGEKTHTLTVDEMPRHYHLIYMGSQGATTFYGTGSPQQQSATVSSVTDFSGGDQPHNNMPPYFAVNAWYRVTEVEFNASI